MWSIQSFYNTTTATLRDAKQNY